MGLLLYYAAAVPRWQGTLRTRIGEFSELVAHAGEKFTRAGHPGARSAHLNSLSREGGL